MLFIETIINFIKSKSKFTNTFWKGEHDDFLLNLNYPKILTGGSPYLTFLHLSRVDTNRGICF